MQDIEDIYTVFH